MKFDILIFRLLSNLVEIPITFVSGSIPKSVVQRGVVSKTKAPEPEPNSSNHFQPIETVLETWVVPISVRLFGTATQEQIRLKYSVEYFV